MYAIIDVETTGGQFNDEGITEIAIYKYDGSQVVDQFISLINPEKPIQPFVVKLTGISTPMLRNAPKFHEVAKRIVEITENCVLVAHNSSFDYRVIQTEFSRLGYKFEKSTLCTVELSKKLIPNMPSYSLGKLVRSLGIPISDRHRASGDALATLSLLKLLLTKDTNKEIVSENIKIEIKQKISSKHLDIIEKLPFTTGVYYIYNQEGTIVYIGKSKNIRKRITQHLVGKSRKEQNIQKVIFEVSFEETGNELLALLIENESIKKHKPIYNRALRRSVFLWGLYDNLEKDNYLSLNIEKLNARKKEISSFTTIQEAKKYLFSITEKYQLCQKINGLYDSSTLCFQYNLKECFGACINIEKPEDYNSRVTQFISENTLENKSFIIIDQGRIIEEKTAILVENGIVKGYCFYDLNFQVNHIEILKNLITPLENNRDCMRITNNYLIKNKVKKIIEF
jgi:DNA polymerase III subunit epsilon